VIHHAIHAQGVKQLIVHRALAKIIFISQLVSLIALAGILNLTWTAAVKPVTIRV